MLGTDYLLSSFIFTTINKISTGFWLYDILCTISLITIKIIIIIFLLLVSIINKDTYYIKKNPINFFIETLLCGICGGISTLYIYNYSNINKSSNSIISSIISNFDIFILGFCLYASINILLQISGSYSLLYDSTTNPIHTKKSILGTSPDKLIKGFSYSIYIIMILCVLLGMGNIIYKLYNSQKIDYKHYSFLFLQSLIMGVVHIVPLIIITQNRSTSLIEPGNKLNFNNIFNTGILFIILHLSSSVE